MQLRVGGNLGFDPSQVPAPLAKGSFFGGLSCLIVQPLSLVVHELKRDVRLLASRVQLAIAELPNVSYNR